MKGQCHCGNVKLEIPEVTETGTSCNCSVCSRYGAIWGYFTKADVTLTIGDGGLSSYCYGDKSISFNFCKVCGGLTHYSSTTHGAGERLAVNYRMFGPDVLEQIRIRHFDGAATWKYLD
ncbi:GFA family protein [Reinekea marinisedimentorum]|uniref:CENP-V/GFA domain-containing protein n=1 Tax=Reinekea marinisedimentorum TaxID=230495 RepID=A0A4R3I4E7_9GAMM|nr:aldehyde-activating protein [Reinekea marinisedimentorum]TCS39761.1 hypothetical protein BCF53_11246 [Reinekea marinisedimentorum]